MNPNKELDLRARAAKSLQDSASVLFDLLSGGYAVWGDGSLYNVKQLVSRVKGLNILVYSNEHSPPHFHVKSPDVDASFTIQDCTFLNGNIDGREIKLVHWWYERSRSQLIAAWNATRSLDCPVGFINE